MKNLPPAPEDGKHPHGEPIYECPECAAVTAEPTYEPDGNGGFIRCRNCSTVKAPIELPSFGGSRYMLCEPPARAAVRAAIQTQVHTIHSLVDDAYYLADDPCAGFPLHRAEDACKVQQELAIVGRRLADLVKWMNKTNDDES